MKNMIRAVPRLQDIFFASLFIAVLLLGNRMINLDGDLPRHLLFGRIILAEKRIPSSEPLIYPYADRPYVSHEWLSQVIYQTVYSLANLRGLALLAAILIGATFTITYGYLVRQYSLRLPILFLVGWGAAVTSLNWAIRPHLFSMLLLAIWLVWTDQLRRGEAISIWRFPILMVVWSNLHGVFIAGILALVAFAAGWVVDFLFDPKNTNHTTGGRLWLALLSSVIASLLNPSGAGSWFSILGFVNNGYLMSRMLEANSPNFQLPEMRAFLLLLILSIFLLAFKREKLSAGQGLLIAGFTAMSLMAFRNIHLYGVVAPFALAGTVSEVRNFSLINRLEGTLAHVENQIKGFLWPFVTVLSLGLLVLTSPLAKTFYQFDPETFPTEAVTWLKANPQQGHMFNDLNWGGYLELNLWPAQKTFVDSIADVTGEVTMEYETILTQAPGWEKIVEKYGIAWAVIEADSSLAKNLVGEQSWQILYQDDTAVILKKQ